MGRVQNQDAGVLLLIKNRILLGEHAANLSKQPMSIRQLEGRTRKTPNRRVPASKVQLPRRRRRVRSCPDNP